MAKYLVTGGAGFIGCNLVRFILDKGHEVVVLDNLATGKIENLTYSTATEAQKRENRESWNKWDVIASVGVLGLVLAMYLYFSFWLK